MSLPAHMLTAPGREDILAGTLARWTAAGCGGAPVIQCDPGPRAGHGLGRIMAAWRWFLRIAAESPAAHTLLMEDDLDLAPRFPQRAAAWGPLGEGRVGAFGFFFNPGVPVAAGERHAGQGDDWFIAEPAGVLGSQALVVAREFAQEVLAEWGTLDGFPVMKMAALAARRGLPVYYHRPSLVEHVGTVSAWGGHLRRSVDFPEGVGPGGRRSS